MSDTKVKPPLFESDLISWRHLALKYLAPQVEIVFNRETVQVSNLVLTKLDEGTDV